MDEIVKICKKHGNLIKSQVYYHSSTGFVCSQCKCIQKKLYYHRNIHKMRESKREWCRAKRKGTADGRRASYIVRHKLPVGIEKICKFHGQLKIEEIYFQKCKTWISRKCKYCTKNYQQTKTARNKRLVRQKIDRKINPDKYQKRQLRFRNKDRRLIVSREIARKRNISVEQYEQMFIDQENKCYICKGTQPVTIRKRNGSVARLFLDHCHKTGKVRKLLCSSCNIMLGGAKDSIDTLQNAIKYLQEF